MRVLLDTCTLLWLTADPGRLGPQIAKVLEDPSQVLLSDCSVWEICLKWQAKKLFLPGPPRNWVAQQKQIWQLSSLSIQSNHLFSSSELPDHHRDPFDRLLVSQAIAENVPIATPDPWIQKYAVATLW